MPTSQSPAGTNQSAAAQALIPAHELCWFAATYCKCDKPHALLMQIGSNIPTLYLQRFAKVIVPTGQEQHCPIQAPPFGWGHPDNPPILTEEEKWHRVKILWDPEGFGPRPSNALPQRGLTYVYHTIERLEAIGGRFFPPPPSLSQPPIEPASSFRIAEATVRRPFPELDLLPDDASLEDIYIFEEDRWARVRGLWHPWGYQNHQTGSSTDQAGCIAEGYVEGQLQACPYIMSHQTSDVAAAQPPAVTELPTGASGLKNCRMIWNL
ncbi:hypothetical protein BDZ91DRAFT_798183 [Kalaharituber pfeilii]|nr:hypothetical protein BDZ91DRAFT_798183 [Kalaharituber pfeilii]